MSAHRAGGRRRPLRRLAAAVTALLTVPLLSVVVAGQAQAQAPGASSPTASTAGAPVPFVEQNAALDATTDGSVLAPNYYYGTLASEATGRTAVRLAGQGQYVQFTLTAPANAVDFHYAIPDSSDGSGLTDPLSMYVDGDFDAALSLTSKYSWLYGAYQFSNTPTVGEPDNNVPHDFYDDVRAMFPSVLPVGTTVRLQIDSGDNAPWYVINTADFENVAAPIAQPAGSIDVTQAPYDVDPTGARDSTQGLVNAISAAETAGTGVYLPEGTYQINQPIGLNKVAVRGAGEWYTTLTGSNVGFYGNVLSIFGQTDHRDDSDGTVNGFNGGFNDTTISHVWIQNTKCGAWIVGATTNLTLDAVRIQDTMADGVNFDGAVTGSTVRNSFLRNTQDDGLAMWSTQADSGDSFTQNTVDSPGLANNIAIYGGHDNSVTGNLVQDTVTRGGGIHVGNRFGATALAGTTTISGNKLLRTGQFDPGWSYGVGAIWFWALDSAMTGAIDVTGNEIDSSPYEAFQFQSSGGNGITDVTISDDTVDGVGTYVFQNQAKGSVSVSGVTATGVGVAGVQDCASGMVLDQGAGNSGWSSTTCGFPATGALWAFPNVLTFQNGAVGTATATQQVSIMNTGDAAATLGSITASSGFTVKPDPNKPCGSSLAATAPAADGPWCQVDVSFTAPAAGVTNGTLTIPSSEPGSPTTVALVGTSGTGGTVNHPLTATPGSLTFGSLPVGTTSAAQTVTVANPSTTPVAIGSVGVTGPYAQTDNCPSSLPANGSCTVTVRFTPTAGGPQNGSVTIANSSTAFPLTVGLSGIGVSATTNLAGGAPITASSTSGGFPATNADDGDTSSYWESANNAFPQWLRVDLGSAQSVGSVVLDLPPSSAWGARTQTLSVLDSVDGSSWSTLKASAGYTFDPATGNTVTIALPSGTTARYVEVSVTANTAWPAAQISEFQVF
jgi:F5/8 type C domain/Abnormal spindle-like microcephaly-assoc'd, ASPM-SPD-2-Hydin